MMGIGAKISRSDMGLRSKSWTVLAVVLAAFATLSIPMAASASPWTKAQLPRSQARYFCWGVLPLPVAVRCGWHQQSDCHLDRPDRRCGGLERRLRRGRAVAVYPAQRPLHFWPSDSGRLVSFGWTLRCRYEPRQRLFVDPTNRASWGLGRDANRRERSQHPPRRSLLSNYLAVCRRHGRAQRQRQGLYLDQPDRWRGGLAGHPTG